MLKKLKVWSAIRGLKARQRRLLEMARDAQRSGDIQGYARLTEEANVVTMQLNLSDTAVAAGTR